MFFDALRTAALLNCPLAPITPAPHPTCLCRRGPFRSSCCGPGPPASAPLHHYNVTTHCFLPASVDGRVFGAAATGLALLRPHVPSGHLGPAGQLQGRGKRGGCRAGAALLCSLSWVCVSMCCARAGIVQRSGWLRLPDAVQLPLAPPCRRRIISRRGSGWSPGRTRCAPSGWIVLLSCCRHCHTLLAGRWLLLVCCSACGS